jgi:hypothetical protein
MGQFGFSLSKSGKGSTLPKYTTTLLTPNKTMSVTTLTRPPVLDKEEEVEAQDWRSSPAPAAPDCGWRDALMPLLLVLAAHLAMGYVTELFHHRGAHVGLRE